jgi:hypothetical protein
LKIKIIIRNKSIFNINNKCNNIFYKILDKNRTGVYNPHNLHFIISDFDASRIEIDNNAGERSLRSIAIGRKNWLFAGSDNGGHTATNIFSLIETAKLNSRV